MCPLILCSIKYINSMLYENKILLKFKIQINKYLIINLLFVRLASHYHRENSSLCCSASSPASTNVFWKAVENGPGRAGWRSSLQPDPDPATAAIRVVHPQREDQPSASASVCLPFSFSLSHIYRSNKYIFLKN